MKAQNMENEIKVKVDSGWFTGVLTILFIALKLTGHITWSWWWVLSPIWISASIFLLIFIIFLIVYFVK